MLDDAIPTKTAAGRQEIEQRSLRLGARHRTVLIAINGERKLDAVRRQFEAFGDVMALIGELAEAGLIEFHGVAANDARAPVASAVAKPAEAPVVAEPVAPVVSPLPLARQFMNESVVANLGLRAFLFTLKIERCYTRQELTDLLPEYRRVLAKSLKPDAVAAFSARAEALIARI